MKNLYLLLVLLVVMLLALLACGTTKAHKSQQTAETSSSISDSFHAALSVRSDSLKAEYASVFTGYHATITNPVFRNTIARDTPVPVWAMLLTNLVSADAIVLQEGQSSDIIHYAQVTSETKSDVVAATKVEEQKKTTETKETTKKTTGGSKVLSIVFLLIALLGLMVWFLRKKINTYR